MDAITVLTQEEEALREAALDEQEHKRFLRTREIWAFLLTTLGQRNLTTYVGTWMQYFMMNFLRLSGTAFGTASLITSIWDALDDPISGIIIDRTRTRWGRLRPFMIIPMPLWIMTTLMFFTVPWFLSAGQRVAYAIVASILNSIAWSYYGAWELLLYNVTPNTNERNKLIAMQKFTELFGVWVPSMVPIVVDFLPKLVNAKQQNIYTGFAMVFLLFAVGATLFGFFNMRERVPLASRDQLKETSVLKSFLAIIRNRPLFALLLSEFFGNVKGIGGASESFFWLNNTGRLTNGTIAGLFTGLPNYFIIPLTPKLIRKFGARNCAIGAGVFGGIAYSLLFIIGYKPLSTPFLNIVWLITALTICGLPNQVISVCTPVLRGDMFDYLEWKIGVRNEGLVRAVSGYIIKLSTSVIGLLSGLVFDLIKYVPLKDAAGNLIPHTNPDILLGIFAVFALAPAVARFGYGLSILLFNVHGKFRDRMLEDLAERRVETANKNGATEQA